MKKLIKSTLQCTLPHFFKLYIKKVDGIENIPNKGPFIVAANHCSYMDHYLISSTLLLKRNLFVRYLAKKEHFTGMQKYWHELVDAIPIDRQKNWQEGLYQAYLALKKGDVIGIYPEGTRSLNGKIQQGKLGVARLALRAEVPVLPIGIKGTFEMLPKGKTIPKFRKATLKIGKLMYFNEFYDKGEKIEVLTKITNKIMKEIAKLSDQKYNF